MEVIRLNEEKLRNIVSKCVKRVLNESAFVNWYRGINLYNLDFLRENVDACLDKKGWSREKIQRAVDKIYHTLDTYENNPYSSGYWDK